MVAVLGVGGIMVAVLGGWGIMVAVLQDLDAFFAPNLVTSLCVIGVKMC